MVVKVVAERGERKGAVVLLRALEVAVEHH